MELQDTNNKYYVKVIDNDNKQSNIYEVVVRRRPIYVVTFVVFGGFACSPQMVEEGDYATAPTSSKVGYTFKGWDFNFNNPITENTSIYAVWEANEYSINFNPNGGSVSPTSKTVTYMKVQKLRKCIVLHYHMNIIH